MLAPYRVPFVQGLFPLALGFVNFVLNLSRTAFWLWCILVMVNRRGKMQFIRNMKSYVTNWLTCLSSLGLLHIVHLTMPLTLLMKMHYHHAISSTNLARTHLMLCRSTLMKCWKRGGYNLAYHPIVHQSCLYARKWERCICVSTSAV